MLRRKLACVLALSLAWLAASCVTPRSPADLVNVQKKIPNIVLDIRYATTNNFTGQKLYTSSKCFLRRATAEKLARAQKELNEMGLGLKVFDGYRPLSVQWKMWKVYPHAGYVADPRRGSRHNRGAAVDVTLMRLGGTELLMPTGFDDFTEKANRTNMNSSAEAILNRQLLERVMTKNGFEGLPTEWWHFDDKDWRRYDIIDIDPEQRARR